MVVVSRREITEGSLARALVLLAVPLVLQNLVQVAQQVVDTFWVGQLGESAVAAVGLNFPVIALLFAAILGVNTGTQVLVSQRVGGEDRSGARRVVVHGVTLGVSVGLVLFVLVVLVGPTALSTLAPVGVSGLAVTYLTTYAAGLPIVGMSDALEMGFVGWGDSRAALYVNVTAVVVNLALDPVFIFGLGPAPAMGIQGAALATVLGYAAGCLLALGLVLSDRDGYTVTRDSLRLRLADFRELVAIGAPNTAQHAARTSARVVIVGVASAVGGTAGLAAFTVCARVASVAYIPAGGLNRAAQSVVGQNLGAGRPDRAGRATWVGAAMGVAGLSVVAVGQWLVPGALTHLFVPDMSLHGIALTVDGLRIYALGYWAIGAFAVFEAGFNAARRTQVSMVASLLQYWLVRLPVVLAGAYWLRAGVHAVFWAVAISNVVGAVAIGGYYRYTTNDGMLDRAVDRRAGTTAD